MKDVKFQVLWKDRITAEVEIKDNKAHIKNTTQSDPSSVSLGEYRRLSCRRDPGGRCWPRNRDNINDLLHACGLKEYDVMGIIKATHGCMYNDETWIRFEGENLTYSDKSQEDW